MSEAVAPRTGVAQRERILPKFHRPEIEGVRAVAAILVASYHLWTDRVSGGVDVFFVMAGFLTTTTLFGHIDTFGRIRPLIYLGRLARRLLPAAMTVLITVSIATVTLVPHSLWKTIATEIRASALYYENWQLTASSTNYLAQFSDKTPVQHFWAMSTQGQFYVIWVAVFLVLGTYLARHREHARVVVAQVLVALFVASLAYSVYFTAANQPVAYFSTFARVWEFALGGLTAIALSYKPRVPNRIVWLMGWAGLIGLLATGRLLEVASVFPGYAALLPTGCAILILFGASTTAPYAATKLLASRPLVWLGGISYGIYLWHWPLLAIFRIRRAATGNGLYTGLAIIVSAIVLAWLTNRLVERPLRNARLPKARLLSSSVIAIGVVAVLAGTFAITKAETNRIDDANQAYDALAATDVANTPCLGALADMDSSCEPAAQLIPAPEIAVDKWYMPCTEGSNRAGPDAGDDLNVCWLGVAPEDATVKIAMVGDSHSVSMRAAVDEIAKRHGWAVASVWNKSCQTNGLRRITNDAEDVCVPWMAKVNNWLAANDTAFNAVIHLTAAGNPVHFEGGGTWQQASEAAYGRQFSTAEAGIPAVVVIRDTPQLDKLTFRCVEVHQKHLATVGRTCSVPQVRAVKFDPAAAAATDDTDPRTVVVDLTDQFCAKQRCQPVIGGLLAYVDFAHLTSVFSLTLANDLDARLQQALPAPTRAVLYPDSATS